MFASVLHQQLHIPKQGVDIVGVWEGAILHFCSSLTPFPQSWYMASVDYYI